MHTITRGLVDEWSKFEEGYSFNPYTEVSKFTLDMIAHCSFDMQLDSIRFREPPPFSLAMTFFLAESGKRAMRPRFISKYVLRQRDKRYWKTIEKLHALSKQAIQKRRTNGKKKDDILNAMMYATDPVTGKTMTEQSCMQNTVQQLGAGK